MDIQVLMDIQEGFMILGELKKNPKPLNCPQSLLKGYLIPLKHFGSICEY